MNKLFINLATTPIPTQIPDKKFPNLNSATSDIATGEYDYGALGKWVADGLAYFGDKLLDYLNPFVTWGGRIIIISCFIIYFFSGDKRYISAGIKWLIIVTLFWVIRGAVR